VIERTLIAASSLIISDYVPYLWFIPNLQGWPSELQKLSDSQEQVARKIVDIEGHRERAKLRESNATNEAEYVPDFVDILLAEQFEDGKPLPDFLITRLLLVSIMLLETLIFIFLNLYFFSLMSKGHLSSMVVNSFGMRKSLKFTTSVPISRIS
jgi:hypothetical protein